MTMTLTTEQLMLAAKHIANSLVEDVQEFVIPADVEEWSELHNWVDANEYALNAFEDLNLYILDSEHVDTEDDIRSGRDYDNMYAAESVAFAIFRLTADLDAYRAAVKPGFTFEHDDKTFIKTADKVFRHSSYDRALKINAVSDDGCYKMTINLADVRS